MGEEKASQYKDNPRGWQQRWKVEFAAARKAQEKWRKQGVAVDKAYLDEREGTDTGETRWNLFTSTTQTLEALLYGNTPKVDVGRRFADPSDDVGRLAGELMERNLNADFESSDSTDAAALQHALQDRMLPGLGVGRVRYVMEEEEVEGTPAQVHPETGVELAPAVEPTTRKSYECVEADYVHWQDMLWSPARVWDEVRWVAFKNPLTREQLVQRFGKKVGEAVPLGARSERKDAEQNRDADPWGRADVWEVWLKQDYSPLLEDGQRGEKAKGRVFWLVEDFDYTLDDKPDPLGLEGFWPCPRPLFANVTTSKLVPRPDYVLAQDHYTEINAVSTRIDWLQKAIKVVGTYDKKSPEVRRLLDEGVQNQLLPSATWAAFKEGGGMAGAVEFLPIEPIVNALMQLRDYRRELVDMLYQVTGQADIMRGQATQAGTTATEQKIKTRFGSARIDRLQKEFARFATDIQRLKAEIIAKHFDPQTILERANAQFAFTQEDQALLPQAVQLIKSKLALYRIEVKSENVSMQDLGELKAERSEVLSSLSQFFVAVQPMVQSMPGSMPFLLKLLQANLATVRGGSTMEGILDGAITQMEQAQAQAAAQPQQPPPPDPKVQAQQLKMQGDQAKAAADMQKEQFKAQADINRIHEETIAHDQQEQSQARWGVKEATDRALIQHALKPPEAPKFGGLP